VLREDKTAQFEEVAVPRPRPSWRERLSDWMNEAPPRPETEIAYEFSVGKYTFSRELATAWEFVIIPAAEYVRAAETQKVMPVLLMRNARGKRWWWYLDRFYREGEELTRGEVHARVVRMRQDEAERARRADSAASPGSREGRSTKTP
jgi:hypothetical protein